MNIQSLTAGAEILWRVEIVNFHGDVQYYETAYLLPDGNYICIRESASSHQFHIHKY